MAKTTTPTGGNSRPRIAARKKQQAHEKASLGGRSSLRNYMQAPSACPREPMARDSPPVRGTLQARHRTVAIGSSHRENSAFRKDHGVGKRRGKIRLQRKIDVLGPRGQARRTLPDNAAKGRPAGPRRATYCLGSGFADARSRAATDPCAGHCRGGYSCQIRPPGARDRGLSASVRAASTAARCRRESPRRPTELPACRAGSTPLLAARHGRPVGKHEGRLVGRRVRFAGRDPAARPRAVRRGVSSRPWGETMPCRKSSAVASIKAEPHNPGGGTWPITWTCNFSSTTTFSIAP